MSHHLNFFSKTFSQHPFLVLFLYSFLLLFIFTFLLPSAQAKIYTTLSECIDDNGYEVILGQSCTEDEDWIIGPICPNPSNPSSCPLVCCADADNVLADDRVQQCQQMGGDYASANGCPEGHQTMGELEENRFCCKAPSASPTIATAEFDYKPLEPIPGVSPSSSSTLKGFIEGLYLFVMWSVGIAAMFMIVLGGFWYMTSAGNTARVGEAKNMITNALWGLVVALVAWLLLFVINPDLVNIDLSSLDQLAISTYMGGSGSYTGPIVTPPQVGEGTCGGMTLWSQVDPKQCELASSALSSLLTCMKNDGDTGIVTSITDKTVLNDREAASRCCGVKCGHSIGSCHYGCKAGEPGLSHALDYDIKGNESNAQLCAIAERAQLKCGAGVIWGPRNISCANGSSIRSARGHNTHLHISTRACNG